jgi:hypothetical protein
MRESDTEAAARAHKAVHGGTGERRGAGGVRVSVKADARRKEL